MEDNPQHQPYIFYRVISAIFALIAIGIIALMVWSHVDDATGWIAGSFFSLAALLFAIKFARVANYLRNIEENEIATLDVKDNTAIDKVIENNRSRLNTVITATAILSVCMFIATLRVAGDTVHADEKFKTLIVLGIVDGIYEMIGFWPSVLMFPVIGGWYILQLKAKIRMLKSMRDNN